MRTLTIVIAVIVVGLFVVFRIKSAFSKYRAALNALIAKYTYERLDSESQQKVRIQTELLLCKGGYRNPSKDAFVDDDRAKYSFYALAMAELGIPPALRGETWQYVKNPFVALDNGVNQIGAATAHLRKTHGIEVEI